MLDEEQMIQALKATGKAFDERLTRLMIYGAKPDPFADYTSTVEQAKPEQGLTYQDLIDLYKTLPRSKEIWRYMLWDEMKKLSDRGEPVALMLKNDKLIVCHPDTLPLIKERAEAAGVDLIPHDPIIDVERFFERMREGLLPYGRK